jgi:hypothetical protein
MEAVEVKEAVGHMVDVATEEGEEVDDLEAHKLPLAEPLSVVTGVEDTLGLPVELAETVIVRAGLALEQGVVVIVAVRLTWKDVGLTVALAETRPGEALLLRVPVLLTVPVA